MATYNIGSSKGAKIVKDLQPGQTYTAGDGSVWTKGADGGVSVQHNGQTMQGNVTYQAPNYNIGSQTGYDIATGLKTGQQYSAKDGSVWTRNADGTISVMHNGKLMNGNVTYQPEERAPDYDEEWARQILEGLAEYQNSEYGGTNYDAQYAKLLEQAVGMKYDDWTKGEQYKALADRYARGGKMSMQDVLAQVASRTGGLASSYAESVAQQQYNEYMQMLEEAARGQFQQERANVVENAGLYGNAASEQFNRWAQQQSLALQQRQLAQQAAQTLEERMYSRGQTDRAEAQQRIQNYLQAGGALANLDPSLVKKSGYTSAELQAMQMPLGNYQTTVQTSYNPTPTPSPVSAPTFGKGVEDRMYNTVYNSVKQYAQQGNASGVDRMMSQVDANLSKTQYNKLAQLLNKYGYNMKTY